MAEILKYYILSSEGPMTYSITIAKIGMALNANEAINRLDSTFTIRSVSGLTYLLDSSSPLLLENGQEYAWRVTIDEPYKKYYKDNGSSAVGSFTYGSSTCPMPSNFSMIKNPNNVELKWDAVAEAQSYAISHQSANAVAATTTSTYVNGYTIANTDPSLVYTATVKAVCSNNLKSPAANGTTANASNPTLMASPTGLSTPTPDPLASVLNPFANPVSVDANGNPTTPQSTEQMLAQLAGWVPPKCGAGLNGGASCDVEVNNQYSGSEQFSLDAGKMLVINGYKVIITNPGTNGKGLLYYDFFGGVPMPVLFKAVQAYKPTDPSSTAGGCVYAGQMVVEGSDNSVLDADVNSRLASLLAKINDPMAFAGSFREALDSMTIFTELLKTPANRTPENLQKFRKYLKASKQGLGKWLSEINTAFPSPVPDSVATVIANLSTLQNGLNGCDDCLATLIPPTSSNSGGQKAFIDLKKLFKIMEKPT